jgi:cytochrome c556
MIAAMVITLYAQQRDMDAIMKEVGPTFGGMNKNIGSGGAAADVQKDAEKLQGLFKEAGGFMKAQKAEKGVGWARDAETAAGDIAKAAKANDMAAVKAGNDKLKANCKACHDVHREMLPDKTSKFKAP